MPSIPGSINTLVRATRDNTVATDHRAQTNSHDVTAEALTAERSRGIGQNLTDGPTLKTIEVGGGPTKAPATTETTAPKGTVGAVAGKAKSAAEKAGAEVAETSFDVKGALLSREIDQKLVDQRGIDVGYKLLSVHAEGQGSVKVGKVTQLQGNVSVGATVAKVQVQANTKYVAGTANAEVGAAASANADIKVDLFSKRPTAKIQAGGEAFIGAKAGVEGRLGVGPAAVTGRAEVMAGIGGRAKVDVGFEKGKFKARIELGAALGIGGSVAGGVEINYEDAANRAKALAGNAVDTAKTLLTKAPGYSLVAGFFGG